MGDEVADLVAPIDHGRHRRLADDAHRCPAVADAREAFADADNAGEPAVGKSAQLAIEQVIGDQRCFAPVIAERAQRLPRER